MTRKVRRTLTLDPDVVEAFGHDDQALSSTVNAVLREEMERLRRRTALASFLGELDALYGPVDQETVAHFEEALG
jgi:hypothetical protein